MFKRQVINIKKQSVQRYPNTSYTDTCIDCPLTTSVPSVYFCCEPKIAIKNKIYFKKKKKYKNQSRGWQTTDFCTSEIMYMCTFLTENSLYTFIAWVKTRKYFMRCKNKIKFQFQCL